jgi:hypothetical protein
MKWTIVIAALAFSLTACSDKRSAPSGSTGDNRAASSAPGGNAGSGASSEKQEAPKR